MFMEKVHNVSLGLSYTNAILVLPIFLHISRVQHRKYFRLY
jgi:hypothetical protein